MNESLSQIEEKLRLREQKTNFKRDLEVCVNLEMFKSETHSVEFRQSEIRDYMIQEDLISWVPPILGSNNQYAITGKGLQYRKELRNDIDAYLKAQRS